MKSIKLQAPTNSPLKSSKTNLIKSPQTVDLSAEPYDQFLDILKTWSSKSHQQIIYALQRLKDFDFRGLTELESVRQKIKQFKKLLFKEGQKSDNDKSKVEIDSLYFDKITQIYEQYDKKKKNGYFKKQIKAKIDISNNHYLKKNLVNVQVVIPPKLYINQNDEFHRQQLKKLYKAFIAYFVEAHSNNEKTVQFLQQLYAGLRKRHLQQKQILVKTIDKVCQKFKTQKFVENKKKMLSKQIEVRDLVTKPDSVWVDYSALRQQQKRIQKILRESEIGFQNSYCDNEETSNTRARGDNSKESDTQSSESSLMSFGDGKKESKSGKKSKKQKGN